MCSTKQIPSCFRLCLYWVWECPSCWQPKGPSYRMCMHTAERMLSVHWAPLISICRVVRLVSIVIYILPQVVSLEQSLIAQEHECEMMWPLMMVLWYHYVIVTICVWWERWWHYPQYMYTSWIWFELHTRLPVCDIDIGSYWCQVLYMNGWAPDPRQPIAKQRGSATVSFKDLQDVVSKDQKQGSVSEVSDARQPEDSKSWRNQVHNWLASRSLEMSTVG